MRGIWRQRKTPSRNGTDRGKAVLEILSTNGSMTGEDIANQCSFESRMQGAGTIAKLVRAKAIEAIPASYRITEMGRSILLSATTNGQEEQQPKKTKRKSKKEPQEPSSQGDQPSP